VDFTQYPYRKGLRRIECCLRAHHVTRDRMEMGTAISHCLLAYANKQQDSRMRADFVRYFKCRFTDGIQRLVLLDFPVTICYWGTHNSFIHLVIGCLEWSVSSIAFYKECRRHPKQETNRGH